MTLHEELDGARSALVMINPAPFNAEAPPAALAGDITATRLHYVRSNFAVPEHDGDARDRWRRRLAHVAHRRGPARHAVARAGGDARVRRQRTTGHEAATHGRTVGRPCRVHRPLDRGAPARGPSARRPEHGWGAGAIRGRRSRRLSPHARATGDGQRPERSSEPSPWRRPPTPMRGSSSPIS